MFEGKNKQIVAALNDYVKEIDEKLKQMSDLFAEDTKKLTDRISDLESSLSSQINGLDEKLAKQESGLKSNGEKLEQLSSDFKQLSDENQNVTEAIKQMTDEKVSLLTEDIKALNKELFQSKNQLGILRTDVKDIASVNKSIAVLRARMDTQDEDKSGFESRLQELESSQRKGMGDINKQFLDLKEDVMKVNQKHESLRQTLDQMKSSVLEEVVSGRDENIMNLSRTIKEQEASRAAITQELAELRTERDNLQNRLLDVEREFSNYKTKSEPDLIKNTHIRSVLRQTEQGKILLELMKVSPEEIKLEDLSDRVGVASVIVKTAVNAMHDMRLVRYNPESRTVRLL